MPPLRITCFKDVVMDTRCSQSKSKTTKSIFATQFQNPFHKSKSILRPSIKVIFEFFLNTFICNVSLLKGVSHFSIFQLILFIKILVNFRQNLLTDKQQCPTTSKPSSKSPTTSWLQLLEAAWLSWLNDSFGTSLQVCNPY